MANMFLILESLTHVFHIIISSQNLHIYTLLHKCIPNNDITAQKKSQNYTLYYHPSHLSNPIFVIQHIQRHEYTRLQIYIDLPIIPFNARNGFVLNLECCVVFIIEIRGA